MVSAILVVPRARVPVGAVHLFGHLHGRGHPVPGRLDVGVDAMGCARRRLDRILEELTAGNN